MTDRTEKVIETQNGWDLVAIHDHTPHGPSTLCIVRCQLCHYSPSGGMPDLVMVSFRHHAKRRHECPS